MYQAHEFVGPGVIALKVQLLGLRHLSKKQDRLPVMTVMQEQARREAVS
jgi:hypothetical protein